MSSNNGASSCREDVVAMKSMGKFLAAVSPAVVFLSILGLIELAIVLFGIPKYVLPSPFQVLKYLFRHGDEMAPHFVKTGLQFFAGYPLGALAGIALALVFTINRVLNKAVSPYLMILICTPQLIMVPLLKMWIGFGMQVCIIAGALSCFAIIMTNTMTGVSMVPPERIELMQSFKASKWQTFFMVIFPSSLPSVFTGLKLGCIFALTGIIGAELTGDTVGVGAMILSASELIKLELMFAYIIVLMVFGYVAYTMICILERRFVKEE